MSAVKKLSVIMMLLLATSCETPGKEHESPNDGPEEAPTLSVSPSEHSLGEAGGVAKVTVSSNSDWSVKSDADWAVVNATGGTKGTTEVEVDVKPNAEKSSRLAHVAFRVGSKLAFTLIKQSGAAQIGLSAANVSVDAGECTKVVVVKTNADWTISSSETWCRVSPQNGTAGTTAVTVSCDENTEKLPRKATLTVESGLAKAEIVVTQDAA